MNYAASPKFYAQLTAVQNGNIYQYPSSTSYYSNVEIPIVNSYYVTGVLYPEQFKDIDFEKKANAGALLLILADTFGRLIIKPVILPIGAITSFLGAPMFLFLLFKGFKSNG